MEINMPVPHKGEKKSDFLERYMGSAHAQKFPPKQRFAVANSEWKDAKKK
jgi:hypothetical protein